MLWRPSNLENIRTRAYCACRRCEWGCLDIFSLALHASFLSPSLWKTAEYRLKYCLKGPFNPKQPIKPIQLLLLLAIFIVFLLVLTFCSLFRAALMPSAAKKMTSWLYLAPRKYFFFILNSAEYEFFPASKC